MIPHSTSGEVPASATVAPTAPFASALVGDVASGEIGSLTTGVDAHPAVLQYRSIQNLRAVAAILVVVMHTLFFYDDSIQYLGGNSPHMATFFHFKGFGGCGVQLFFVISGFIMAYLNAIGETRSFGAFAYRRITRVVPLYWILTCVWVYWLMPPGSYAAPKVLQSLFFIPRPDNTAVLGPGWSLNFEMFFYLVFGTVMLALRQSAIWLVAAFLLLGVLGSITNFYVFRLYSDPIVWNFVAGVAIYHVHCMPAIRRHASAILMCGAMLLLSSIYWHVPDSSFGARQVLPWGVPSMLIVLGSVSMEAAGRGRRLFGSSIMLELGNASYALYLTHSLCFIGVSKLVFYTLRVQARIGADGAVLVFIAIAIAIAIAVHHLVEKPVNRGIRRLSTALATSTSRPLS